MYGVDKDSIVSELIHELKAKKDGAGRNLIATCPFCGKKGKFGVYIGKETERKKMFMSHCFSCGRSITSLNQLLSAIDRTDLISFPTVDLETPLDLEILFPIQKEEEIDNSLTDIELPDFYRRVFTHSYLDSRGFTSDDYDFFTVGTTRGLNRRFDDYVLFPVIDNLRVVGYVARHVWNKSKIDAYNAKAKRKGDFPILRFRNSIENEFSKLLYNYDSIVEGETETVIVVEGIFDVVALVRKLNLYEDNRIAVVATFGKKISLVQIYKLQAKGIGRLILAFDGDAVEQIKRIAFELKRYFDVYYQVDLSEYKAERFDLEVLKAMKFYFDNFYVRDFNLFLIDPVLISDSYYLDKEDAGNKILLNKINNGASHLQSDDQYYKDTDDLFTQFESLFDKKRWDVEWLFRVCCENTFRIASNANAYFDTDGIHMPKYIMSEEEKARYTDSRTLFHELLREGLKDKTPVDKFYEYKKRFDDKVYIIESTNNADYFLIQWDIVREARKRCVEVGIGRGSAGGSLMAYLLGITSIDPIKYNLLFSRFLVPERCGLEWKDNVTKIDGVATIYKGFDIIEVATEHAFIQLDPTSTVFIKRGDVELCTKAFDLREGDEMILDTKDKIWKLKY